MFKVSADDYHETMEYLLDNEPEIMDYVLRKKAPCRTRYCKTCCGELMSLCKVGI